MHTVEKYLISFLLKNFFPDTVHQVQKPIPKLQIPNIYVPILQSDLKKNNKKKKQDL